MRADVAARLLADARFVGAGIMVRRFDEDVARWRKNGSFRSVINDGNELSAALAILDDMRPQDQLLYEPKLAQTRKSIDFCVMWADGARSWIDMKTVAPQWKNDAAAWEQFSRIARDFPDNATLIVDRDFCGAALGTQFLKARWSLIQRTIELEAKVALLTPAEKGSVRLLVCNEGAWHEDDLEDFADLYFSGHFRADDWAQNAIARYMTERNLAFRRTLAGFCYLERHHDETSAGRFTVDVRGPRFYGPVAA
ncbi:MAG TPA: hypothetical protein VGH02_12290 [Rhizomicrobium sp.]